MKNIITIDKCIFSNQNPEGIILTFPQRIDLEENNEGNLKNSYGDMIITPIKELFYLPNLNLSPIDQKILEDMFIEITSVQPWEQLSGDSFIYKKYISDYQILFKDITESEVIKKIILNDPFLSWITNNFINWTNNYNTRKDKVQQKSNI